MDFTRSLYVARCDQPLQGFYRLRLSDLMTADAACGPCLAAAASGGMGCDGNTGFRA